jgi:hypothetical protein
MLGLKVKAFLQAQSLLEKTLGLCSSIGWGLVFAW